jgi:hypothetical protein
MPTFAFTVVDEGTETVVEGSTTDHGAVFIPPAEIERALRWQLKPEGFCLNDVCYPVPPDVPVVSTNGVDLAALASLLDRPIAVDVAERAAFLGTAAARRAETLGSLEAPGFTLPDLEGKPHSLSDHRGKKVLLAAYASW